MAWKDLISSIQCKVELKDERERNGLASQGDLTIFLTKEF
jgi:hypothetical protein